MAYHHHPRRVRAAIKARRRGSVSVAKAKEILRHGEVKGRRLTKKQRGFFGARAGGAPVRRGGAAAARARSTSRYRG